MITTKQALIVHLQQGNTAKYLHFWGHMPKSEAVDKSCLSQWFPATFELDDVTYPSAEHYMMAQKARLFGDTQALNAILASPTPDTAKKLGRQVKNFDNDLWSQHCFDYVVQGNIAKFGQNPELKNFLLNTGHQILVEASPLDAIWGIGLAAAHPDASTPQRWQGENLLGFALMAAREHLRQTSLQKHASALRNYNGDMQQLAEELGDLFYDSLADFLHLLGEKMQRDAESDAWRKRPKLAGHLHACSQHLQQASAEIDKAWKISKPHTEVQQ
ncbi:MAG: NADAR family protein [Gammaproteobacteria bacterium]|nr:NADAR family protein [Gammaproteobacteria bacterium]MBU1724824.1 NADAR family protein [Gammaproteobacteria bacterium]MBU2006513.1 NADAR family protein [Gammaproteobacteria bacterium]